MPLPHRYFFTVYWDERNEDGYHFSVERNGTLFAPYTLPDGIVDKIRERFLSHIPRFISKESTYAEELGSIVGARDRIQPWWHYIETEITTAYANGAIKTKVLEDANLRPRQGKAAKRASFTTRLFERAMDRLH